MNMDTDKKESNATDKETSCECRSCCSGPRKWIFLVIVLLIVGVLIAKNAAEKTKSEKPWPDQVSTATSVQQQASEGTGGVTTKIPKLVDLGSESCIPCRMMAPILDELKKEYVGIFDVQFIDVWKNPSAGGQYGIRVIPTQIFFDSEGKELFRHEGFFSKEDILKTWEKYGINIRKKETQ